MSKLIKGMLLLGAVASLSACGGRFGYEDASPSTLVSARSPIVLINDSRYTSPNTTVIPTTLPEGVMEK